MPFNTKTSGKKTTTVTSNVTLTCRSTLRKYPGGNNKLRISIQKYDIEWVRCYGSMLAPNIQKSCQEILDTMVADDRDLFFGPKSDPLVDIVLPYLLLSKDRRCKMTIRTTGKGHGDSDHWSFGRFWEAGVALVGKCVRQGKEGVQTKLGEDGFLYMEVGGPQDGLLEGDVTE